MSKTHRRTGARSARAVCCEPDGSPRAGGIARGMARPRAAPRAVRLSGCGARSRRCFGTREGDLLAISRKRIPQFTGSRVARGLSFGAPAGHGEEVRRRRLKKLLTSFVQRSKRGVKHFANRVYARPGVGGT